MAKDNLAVAEKLTALPAKGKPNSPFAVKLMRRLRGAADTLPLDLACGVVQTAGLLLLDETRFCVTVADRFVNDPQLHTARFVRRLIVGLGNLRIYHAGVAKITLELAGRSQLESEMRSVLRGAAVTFPATQFVRLWLAFNHAMTRSASTGLARALSVVADATSQPLPAPVRAIASRFDDVAAGGAWEEAASGLEELVAADLEALRVSFRRRVILHGVECDFVFETKEGGKAVLHVDGVRYHHIGNSPCGLLAGKDVLNDRALNNRGVVTARINSDELQAPDRLDLLVGRLRRSGV